MTQRLKSIIINLSVGLASLLITLIILEILVRLFFQPPPSHSDLFVEYDPLLGWSKIPNVTGQHITPEYTIVESINSRGVRGPEYPYEKPDDEYRILILGDSFSEGYMVEFHELFSEVLKDRLNSQDNLKLNFEVINTGTGGYSTDQEFLLFYSEGKKYHPDLTILMFYDNDVWYNNQHRYWRGQKPQFVLYDNQILQLTNVPVPVQRENEQVPEFTVETWLISNVHLYRFLEARTENLEILKVLSVYSGEGETLPQSGDNSQDIRSEYRVYRRIDTYELAKAWEITEILLIKLKEETRSINSELLLFHIPMQQAIYPELWEKMKTHYKMDEENWSIDQVRTKLADICSRNEISCIQPHEAFRLKAEELSETEQRLYYPQDGHWNVHGHKFAAEILENYILYHFLSEMANNKDN